jgi:predicted DNA-binding protein
MTTGVTTSIRLPQDLNNQLNQAKHLLHRGKNWIITQAVKRYLAELAPLNLSEEAKRQSLLASKISVIAEENLWEDNYENEDWQ